MENMTLEKRILATIDWGLVAMLHEGLMERFEESIESIKEKDYKGLNILINSCRDILTELIITFNENDKLSTDLREIYLFINTMITEGEIKKEKSLFEKAKEVINPIYEGFKELEMKDEANIVSGLIYGKEKLEDYNRKSSKTFQG